MGCEYQKCCFCINLRFGSLIIGYFHLIAGIFTVAGAIVLFINGIKHHEDNVFLGFLGANMILRFISVILTIGLLFGILKYQYRYIQPYLMYNAVLVVFYVVDLGVALGYGVKVSNIVTNVLSFIITIYFLLIIRSYCLELKRQGNPMAPTRPVVYSAPEGSAVVYQPTSTQIV